MKKDLPKRARNLYLQITRVDEARDETIARLEHDAIKVALTIAEKILRREATLDRELALTFARIAFARLNEQTNLRLHLHPTDFAFPQARRDTFSSTVELIEDPTLASGDCLIKSEAGDIDATLSPHKSHSHS